MNECRLFGTFTVSFTLNFNKFTFHQLFEVQGLHAPAHHHVCWRMSYTDFPVDDFDLPLT